MKDCPCRGCGKRTVEPNCHGHCGRYAEWLERLHAEKAADRVARDAVAHSRERFLKYCRRVKARRKNGQI